MMSRAAELLECGLESTNLSGFSSALQQPRRSLDQHLNCASRLHQPVHHGLVCILDQRHQTAAVISRAAVLQEAGGVALQAVSNALLLVDQVMLLHEDKTQLI